MKLLIFKEKHGERYFSYSTQEEFLMLCEFMVRERNDDQVYEDITAKDEKLLKAALTGDRKAAWTFLSSRAFYEYEGYDLVETEKVKGVPHELSKS